METPFRRALREARLIIVIGPLIAIAYNLLASTGISWIREVRHGEIVSYDSLIGGSSTPAATDTATMAGPAVALDTVAGKDTATADAVTDTAAASLLRQQQAQTQMEDSIRQAKAREALRVRDSIKKAQTQQKTETPPQDLGKEINTATARRIFDEKKALFVDARPAAQFGEGHIPGAINVYAEDFNPNIPMLLKYPNDTLVVAYCGGGLCELSHELADKLRTLGFKRVVVYTGGTTEWNANNYPFTGK
jgi:rhodanese-related sulfurtransferase